jgi:CheY-like chemotaxis protein/DNA-binding XRE family transcriptional regulator
MRMLSALMTGNPILARVGASIKQLRNRLGISQEELAERADLHRTYIAGIERGRRNITLKSMEKLANALQVSLEVLLGCREESGGAVGAGSAGLVDVLLVEDSPDDEALTLQAFAEVHFANRVSVVRTGAEALEYLFCTGKYLTRGSELQPHVVLLDLNLPKIGGLEVLRRLKAERKTRDIPVIVLTASSKSADVRESRRLGAATYIVKPVDFGNFTHATAQFNSLKWGLMTEYDAGRSVVRRGQSK